MNLKWEAAHDGKACESAATPSPPRNDTLSLIQVHSRVFNIQPIFFVISLSSGFLPGARGEANAARLRSHKHTTEYIKKLSPRAPAKKVPTSTHARKHLYTHLWHIWTLWVLLLSACFTPCFSFLALIQSAKWRR